MLIQCLHLLSQTELQALQSSERSADKEKLKKESEVSCMDALINISSTIVLLVTFFIYPFVLIPVYQSDVRFEFISRIVCVCLSI